MSIARSLSGTEQKRLFAIGEAHIDDFLHNKIVVVVKFCNGIIND